MIPLLTLLTACAGAPADPTPAPDPAPTEEPSPMPSPSSVEVTETRTHEGREASAAVSATTDDEEVRRLAGALAWRSLAQGYTGEESWDAALACAQGGVDELGRSYRPPSVRDDTRMKLHAVTEQLEAGRTDNAARTLLDILDSRIAMMRERLGERLVAPPAEP